MKRNTAILSLIFIISLVFQNNINAKPPFKVLNHFFAKTEWGHPLKRQGFRKPNTFYYRIDVDGLTVNAAQKIAYTSHLKIITSSGQVALNSPNIVKGEKVFEPGKFLKLSYKISFDANVPNGEYFAQVEIVDLNGKKSIISKKKVIVRSR